MDRRMFRFPATAWLIAALLLPTAGATCPEPAPPHARVKDSGSEPDVIRTRDEFDRWMHACPQVLAPLGSLARERFLQHMEFNENGVTGYPVAELEEALTTAEISAISKRLGLESEFPGLTPEEAERLRTHPRLPEASAIELKHDRLVRELMRLELERESAEIGAELAILYRSLFATDLDMGPGGHDGHDLGLLFQATTSTVFHGNDDRLLQEATGIYHELSRRGLATRARSTSIWLASSATSDRIVTMSLDTSTKPPCTATSSSPPPERMVTVAISSAPTNGAWPARKASGR